MEVDYGYSFIEWEEDHCSKPHYQRSLKAIVAVSVHDSSSLLEISMLKLRNSSTLGKIDGVLSHHTSGECNDMKNLHNPSNSSMFYHSYHYLTASPCPASPSLMSASCFVPLSKWKLEEVHLCSALLRETTLTWSNRFLSEEIIFKSQNELRKPQSLW